MFDIHAKQTICVFQPSYIAGKVQNRLKIELKSVHFLIFTILRQPSCAWGFPTQSPCTKPSIHVGAPLFIKRLFFNHSTSENDIVSDHVTTVLAVRALFRIVNQRLCFRPTCVL